MGGLVKETPYSEITATLELLDRYGVRREHLARLRTGDEEAKRVAELIRGANRGGFSSSERAREILGRNFFGPEEWQMLYGALFTKKQLRDAAEFPWSEDVLTAPCPFMEGKQIAETHFAFLGMSKLSGKPLNIIRWQELHPLTGQPRFRFDPDPHYSQERYVTELTCELRWYLMPLAFVPDTKNRLYHQLVAALPDGYEVASVIAEVTKHILFQRKNGTYLNPDRYAWCAEMSSREYRVQVGLFNVQGLWICEGSDYSTRNVSLAVSRESLEHLGSPLRVLKAQK